MRNYCVYCKNFRFTDFGVKLEGLNSVDISNLKRLTSFIPELTKSVRLQNIQISAL